MGEGHESRWPTLVAHRGSTYHENEENEEDKGGEVDGSEHWIGLLDLWELKVSQNDPELCESAQMEATL